MYSKEGVITYNFRMLSISVGFYEYEYNCMYDITYNYSFFLFLIVNFVVLFVVFFFVQIGFVMHVSMGTSLTESTAAAGNMFLGQVWASWS